MINFSDIRAAYNQKVTEYITNGFEVVQTSNGLDRNDTLLYNSTVMRSGDATVDIVLHYTFDFELYMPALAITVINSDDYIVEEMRFFASSNPDIPMWKMTLNTGKDFNGRAEHGETDLSQRIRSHPRQG